MHLPIDPPRLPLGVRGAWFRRRWGPPWNQARFSGRTTTMQRFILGTSGLLVGLGLLLLGTPAHALITNARPLKAILDEANHICVAKIEKIDPDRPAMVLVVDADLKGKLPTRRLPVNLKGDSEGQKLKHPPQLLKRFAKDLPVVLFMIQKGNRVVGFGFSNGTWFQLLGRKDPDSDRVSWML